MSRLLSELTTLRVGGPAGHLLIAETTAELIDSCQSPGRLPILLVGGGSNLLVADEGFPGLVVLVRSSGVTVTSAGEDVLVSVAAGEPWDRLVARAVESGWSGPEALSGIPGSVGATPIQNVGAYGADVAGFIESVAAFEPATGTRRRLTPSELEFGYRTSLLKRRPARWVVLEVTFRFRRSELSAPIRYAELARRLEVELGARAPLRAVREAVLKLRRSKGMVLDNTDHDTWSAGSFFTNPIVSADQLGSLPDTAPRFAQSDGRYKTSAAWLITNSGFERGYRVNPGSNAALSSKHSLALTNRGGASAEELLELARTVRAGVSDHFAVELENEPVLVGCQL